jgi:ethanolamine utilization protein EutQ (cupin superfamily)
LEIVPRRRGLASSERVLTRDLAFGEWSLTAAAYTDRHQHEEINYVLEGELHVTWGGTTHVAGPGCLVVTPPGERARYEAPVHARMLYIYGPSSDGHAASHVSYEDLAGP